MDKYFLLVNIGHFCKNVKKRTVQQTAQPEKISMKKCVQFNIEG